MALKPEYLNMIPEFHGESELLARFIEVCEKLVTKFYDLGDPTNFQNDYLMSSIIAKIKGEAAKSISSSVINSWQDLKNALLNSYGDKRDLLSLNSEITLLKQTQNESPFEFFNKVQHLLNLQLSYLSTHSADILERRYLSSFFNKNALRVLLHGLREPIGSQIRVKNPADLNVALHMLTNDFQLELVTNKVDKVKLNQRPVYQPKQSNNSPQQQPRYFNTQYNSKPYLNRQQTSYQRNYVPNNNFPVNHFARFNSANNNGNNNSNLPKPTPMSISTYTATPNRNVQNRNQNFGQLYNIDEQSGNFLGEARSPSPVPQT